MKTSFNKAGHKYLIDGKPATGVTTIINVLAKPALIGWAANMAVDYVIEHGKEDCREHPFTWLVDEEILQDARKAHVKKKEAAGEHGTDTHALVEEYIQELENGKPASLLPLLGKENKYEPIEKFIQWSLENVSHFLFSERQMYDKDLFIAGTADFAYVGKDGRKYMADFKTSSGIYGIDYWLQVAAYRMLAEGEGDEPYDGATIVRLGKDGSFEVNQLYEYETFKQAFLSCLNIYRTQAAIKGLIVK